MVAWPGTYSKKPFLKGNNRLPLGGLVVKSLPANAGDMGLIPGPGRFHMPQDH